MARRSRGEGSVYYDPKRKRYTYRITYIDKANGETRRKSFHSSKSALAAKKKGNRFQDDLSSGIDVTKRDETLGTWLKFWLENYKKFGTKTKTFERYQQFVNLYLTPYLGKLPLTKLTPALLQRHFIYLLQKGGVKGKGIAPRSVNSTRRMLISSLEDAIDLGYLLRNPARRTKPMKVEKPKMRVITHEEATALIKAALQRSRVAWLAIILALGTGMRISEIFGLEWQNVNLDDRYLVVNKTVVSTSKGMRVQDSTKTPSSARKIPLPDYVVRALKRYALWQKVLHIRMGNKFAPSSFVFANFKGVPRSPNSFSWHDFKELIKQAGIDPAVRFHDLRHTHATWLLEAGINVKVVSERLGHASIRITLDTYAHVLKTMQAEAVDALDAMFPQQNKDSEEKK